MSSGVSGTQSPPLEATGEQRPMGASSVDAAGAGTPAHVSDGEQRKQYFDGSDPGNTTADTELEQKAKEEFGRRNE